MRYRSSVILFLIAISIGGLYFLYIKPQMEEKKLIEDFEKRFFRADTADIEFLRIDAGRGPITIHKSGKSWKITKPAEYAPDLGAIESLFKALAKGRLIKVVGNAEELDAFGFKTVNIILSLGYSGTIDVLRIAGESPSAAGHYAFSERLGKIFLVDKEFVTAMNLKPLDLREKRLFTFQPEELGRIKIQRKSDTIELEKRGDGWHMISPLLTRADNDGMNKLINTLHTQKAEAFFEWNPDFDKLERKIFLELSDINGSSLGKYGIYYRGKEWDKGIVVHSPGDSEASRTRREFWRLLDVNYSSFAYRYLIPINQKKAQRISILSGEDNFVLENQNGRWHYESSPVPDKTISELIDFLKAWKAEKLIIENRDLGKKVFILEVEYENSTEWVTVTDFNMDHEISSAMMFAARKGIVKKEKIDYLYARSSNLESSAIVSSIDIKNTLDIVRRFRNE